MTPHPPASTLGDAVNLKDQLDALLDATAFDSTGAKIGAVRQVYVDDASGKITFATVATGLFSADAIVPLHGARLLENELHVDHTRDVIRDSPRPDDTEDALTPDQEVKLLEYYGIEAPARGREPVTASASAPKQSAPSTPAGAPKQSAPTPASRAEGKPGSPSTPGTTSASRTEGKKKTTTSSPTTDKSGTPAPAMSAGPGPAKPDAPAAAEGGDKEQARDDS